MALSEVGNEAHGSGDANELREDQQSCTVLQQFFITRLREFVDQQARLAALVSRGDWRLRLLDKAIYSTFRDCVEQRLDTEAQSVLRARRRAQN